MAQLHLIFGQREPLPFGQRVHHFGTGIAQVFDGERYGALHTVQVVVDAKALQHKQRSCYTAQAQLGGEVLLEKLLNQFNALLRLLHVEQGFIVFGND